MPLTTAPHLYQVGPRSPDGTQTGQAPTDPIGFWGATPIPQRMTGNNTLLTTGSTTTISTAVLIEIQATLKALGLMPAT